MQRKNCAGDTTWRNDDACAFIRKNYDMLTRRVRSNDEWDAFHSACLYILTHKCVDMLATLRIRYKFALLKERIRKTVPLEYEVVDDSEPYMEEESDETIEQFLKNLKDAILEETQTQQLQR